MPCVGRVILADWKVLPRSDYGPAFQRYDNVGHTVLLVCRRKAGDLVPDTKSYQGPRHGLDVVEKILLVELTYLVVLSALQNVTRSSWIIINYHKHHHTSGVISIHLLTIFELIVRFESVFKGWNKRRDAQSRAMGLLMRVAIIAVISRGFRLYLGGTSTYSWLSLAGKHFINTSCRYSLSEK